MGTTLGTASLEEWFPFSVSQWNHWVMSEVRQVAPRTQIKSRFLRVRSLQQWFLEVSLVDSYLQLGLRTATVERWSWCFWQGEPWGLLRSVLYAMSSPLSVLFDSTSVSSTKRTLTERASEIRSRIKASIHFLWPLNLQVFLLHH